VTEAKLTPEQQAMWERIDQRCSKHSMETPCLHCLFTQALKFWLKTQPKTSEGHPLFDVDTLLVANGQMLGELLAHVQLPNRLFHQQMHRLNKELVEHYELYRAAIPDSDRGKTILVPTRLDS
jgi:hypothetical protein